MIKIRDKQTILLPNHTTIKRNIYSVYISNNNPLIIRYKKETYLVKHIGKQLFKISNASMKRFAENNPHHHKHIEH